MSELQPPVNLSTAATELLEVARAAKAGRAARTLTPGAGAALKQTLMALLTGQSLAEHDSPDAASLQVLSGTVVLTGNDDQDVELSVDDHTPIPPVRHALHALEDSVVMISVGQDVEPERLRELNEHKGT